MMKEMGKEHIYSKMDQNIQVFISLSFFFIEMFKFKFVNYFKYINYFNEG